MEDSERKNKEENLKNEKDFPGADLLQALHLGSVRKGTSFSFLPVV